MPNRHSNALFIQQGAVNPRAIAWAIVQACDEVRSQQPVAGTAGMTGDPAVRLMVHQLAYICGVEEIDRAAGKYIELIEACERKEREAAAGPLLCGNVALRAVQEGTSVDNG